MSNIHRLPSHFGTRKTIRSRKHRDKVQTEAEAKEMLGWLFQILTEQFPDMEESISEVVARAYRRYLSNPADFESVNGLPLEYYLLYSAARMLKTRLPLRKAA
jgi:hypothetical protein